MPTWLPRARPLFGKVSDHEIARRLGVPRRTVSKERCKLGIAPAPRSDRSWVAKVRPLLGKLPDFEVARRAGVNLHRVVAARRDAGIAPYQRRPKVTIPNARPLTVALLRSSKPAPELSRLTGIHARTIWGRRAALGIQDPPQPAPAWIAKAIPLLGGSQDAEVARRVGATANAVSKLRSRLGVKRAPHPSRALRTALKPSQARRIASGLSSADRVVFEGRFVATPPRTFADLGRELGLTRQAVAARERRISDRLGLPRYLGSGHGRWASR